MINSVKMKAFKISEEDLVENLRFRVGVYEVEIADAEFFETENEQKRIYISVNLKGENGESDSVALWLHTAETRRISLSTIRSILVHNLTEDKKPILREKFAQIRNLNDLEAFLVGLKGAKCWLKIEKSDRTYVNKKGEVKPVYNKNIYAYEPKMRDSAESGEDSQGVADVENSPKFAENPAENVEFSAGGFDGDSLKDASVENSPKIKAVEADEFGTAHFEEPVDLSDIPF